MALKTLQKSICQWSGRRTETWWVKDAQKVTLDKQDVDRVAAYCGDDCVATFRLNQFFDKKHEPRTTWILHEHRIADDAALVCNGNAWCDSRCGISEGFKGGV